mmetsp:Transcript_5522/g.10554  ORF Transcript_5522/g.10554 Transcript_5522/m.10554 type:complete len:249 (+) Transcript_5522:85-831(+)
MHFTVALSISTKRKSMIPRLLSARPCFSQSQPAYPQEGRVMIPRLLGSRWPLASDEQFHLPSGLSITCSSFFQPRQGPSGNDGALVGLLCGENCLPFGQTYQAILICIKGIHQPISCLPCLWLATCQSERVQFPFVESTTLIQVQGCKELLRTHVHRNCHQILKPLQGLVHHGVTTSGKLALKQCFPLGKANLPILVSVAEMHEPISGFLSAFLPTSSQQGDQFVLVQLLILVNINFREQLFAAPIEG